MRTDLSKYKKLKLDHDVEPYLVYLYSTYDQAAQFFNEPVSSALEPEKMLLQMKRAALNGAFHYPNDLTLYLVGVFDSRNGKVIDANSYYVGSLAIGDFARKVNKNGNFQDENQGA